MEASQHLDGKKCDAKRFRWEQKSRLVEKGRKLLVFLSLFPGLRFGN